MKEISGKEFSSGGVVIKKQGGRLKVLLIKDGYGHWTWPKGGIEEGETSRQAAIREIGEEVGLKDIELLDEIDNIQYFYRLKGERIFKTVHIFLFEARSDEKLQVQESEIQDARWLDPEDALRKIEYKGAHPILNKAIDRFKKIDSERQGF